ncbi:MAG: MoaD/ThiS family protein [Verrucomicrobia bacterium]|nr:MoaD/ThiS family protein [Verrucomicrobiota bacterium]MCH8528712.1 MoaD/ThiS family protein [Kiritimatiellia bacterium]
MIPLHVHYFALFREQAGRTDEEIQSAAATLAGLYAELRARHGFTLPPDRVRFAAGDAYADADTPLTPGMSITLIPPVAGG